MERYLLVHAWEYKDSRKEPSCMWPILNQLNTIGESIDSGLYGQVPPYFKDILPGFKFGLDFYLKKRKKRYFAHAKVCFKTEIVLGLDKIIDLKAQESIYEYGLFEYLTHLIFDSFHFNLRLLRGAPYEKKVISLAEKLAKNYQYQGAALVQNFSKQVKEIGILEREIKANNPEKGCVFVSIVSLISLMIQYSKNLTITP